MLTVFHSESYLVCNDLSLHTVYKLNYPKYLISASHLQ